MDDDCKVVSEGVKNDEGKLRMELIPPEALDALASVLTFGANKYGDRNWEKGIQWSRVYGAALRHMNAWVQQKDDDGCDDETGLSHLAHALACITFLVTYERRQMYEFDDLTVRKNA